MIKILNTSLLGSIVGFGCGLAPAVGDIYHKTHYAQLRGGLLVLAEFIPIAFIGAILGCALGTSLAVTFNYLTSRRELVNSVKEMTSEKRKENDSI